MISMKTIAILFGGASYEYEVSLQSSYSIISNIDTFKYNLILIGITKQGEWCRYLGDINNIQNDTWNNPNDTIPLAIQLNANTPYLIETTTNKRLKIDAVFPILHGKNGEDGTVQGLFSLFQIPIIGCDLISSALCMDKYRSHLVIEAIGLCCPTSRVIYQYEDSEEIITKASDIGYPIFVKPLKAGSSFGISKVDNDTELVSAVLKARSYDTIVTLEEAIDGFEVGCAIIGNQNLLIGEVDEIEISNDFFDFKEKYSLQTSKIHIPSRIPLTLANQVKETAKKIYKALGCTTFARVDMFIDQNQNIIFNEVNTIPGFTSHSRFPNMLKAAGYTYQQIIEMIIEEGLTYENYQIKELSYQ